MWQYMEQNNNVWSTSNKEGVERVLKEDGQYAFMMESTVVDYVVERQCELTQVGGLLDNKGYGIGLPPSKSHDECERFLSEHCGDFWFCFDWLKSVSASVDYVRDEKHIT